MKDELAHARNDYDSLLEFVTSIPDYRDVHELSEEQFKQRLDFLKRRQRILLKNLRFCLDENSAEHHQTLIKCDNGHRGGHASQGGPGGQIICCRSCGPTPSSECNSRLSSRPESRPSSCKPRLRPCSRLTSPAEEALSLKGKACHLEGSRVDSPLLYPPGTFSCLAENQDLLSYK